MSGFDELYDFGQVWRGTPNFQTMSVGNYHFRGDIIYTSKKRGVETANCTVTMIRNGIQEGEINILENGPLTNDTHHLALHLKWQKYKFDKEDSSFLIKGSSDKMGGDYVIEIIPNGQPPVFI